MAFEYAVRKDVRNNRSSARSTNGASSSYGGRTPHRGRLVVVVLFRRGNTTSSWSATATGSSACSRSAREEEEINRHLRLEIETLREPRRIERLATQKLRMVAPDRETGKSCGRVTPSAPPQKSIVATR